MIAARDLDSILLHALPELEADLASYGNRRARDPEFTQSFFNYTFLPTLQVALDQDVEDFCVRAFALIERLVLEGDPDVQAILRDEFFAYGPVCEKWMKRAGSRMGEQTRKAAAQ